MRNKARYLMLCSLLFLTGMRDPFLPPEDRCTVGQLAQWRYQGMVKGSTVIGLVRDGQKRWQRVSAGDRLSVGWRVTALDEHKLVVEVGETCDPTQWTWQREGTNKDEFKDNAPADDAQHAPVGGGSKTRHPGGG